MVGPGRPIDTDRFFVICSNVVGGCMGTTGPASTDPATGRAYGIDLPVVTIRDMVRAQAMLVDHGWASTRCFASPAARWAGCRCCNGRRATRPASSPRMPIAAAAKHSSQNIAFHEVGRQADHGRPRRGAKRPLHRGGHAAPQGPRAWRGWPRTSPTSPTTRCNRQVRPQPAGPRGADLLLRRRLPDRELPALPGSQPSSSGSTPTPTSTSPARWTISTSRPTTGGSLAGGVPEARARAFASPPSPPTGCSRRRRRAPSSMRSTPVRRLGLLRRDRDRQGPRRLPPRRAGPDRHDARLPRRRRRARVDWLPT